jgi:hypothetical protein
MQQFRSRLKENNKWVISSSFLTLELLAKHAIPLHLFKFQAVDISKEGHWLLCVLISKLRTISRVSSFASRIFYFDLLRDPVTNKGMVRYDMSKPALIFFFTARVHTTKSTVKILAANTHSKYFLKIAEVTHFFCTRNHLYQRFVQPS